MRAASYGFQPVAITTAPTWRVMLRGAIARSIASYRHAATHFAHSLNRHVAGSIAYFIGNAMACGR